MKCKKAQPIRERKMKQKEHWSPQKRMGLMPADRKNPIYYNNWRKRLGP